MLSQLHNTITHHGIVSRAVVISNTRLTHSPLDTILSILASDLSAGRIERILPICPLSVQQRSKQECKRSSDSLPMPTIVKYTLSGGNSDLYIKRTKVV